MLPEERRVLRPASGAEHETGVMREFLRRAEAAQRTESRAHSARCFGLEGGFGGGCSGERHDSSEH